MSSAAAYPIETLAKKMCFLTARRWAKTWFLSWYTLFLLLRCATVEGNHHQHHANSWSEKVVTPPPSGNAVETSLAATNAGHESDNVYYVANLAKREYRGVIRPTGTAATYSSATPTLLSDSEPRYHIGYISPSNWTNCNHGIRARAEVHDLTPEQLDTYLSAVVMCQQTKLDPNDPASPSVYEQFCVQHHQFNMINHGTATFLPYHRIMLIDYENMLRSCGPDPNLVIPYFNWSIMAAAPWLDPVFSPRWFGDANRIEKCGSLGCCVGKNATYMRPEIMQMHDASSSMNADSDTCLKRNYTYGEQKSQYGLYVWVSVLNMLKNAYRFADFSARWEVWHGALHIWVSGTMATMVSPFDPLFMLHHAYVDHVWHKWQELHDPDFDNFNGFDYENNPVYLNSTLRPYKSLKVQDTLNLTNLCVTYNNTGLLNLIEPKQKLPNYIPINITFPPPLPEDWIRDNSMNLSETQRLQNISLQELQNLQNLIHLLLASGESSISGIQIQNSSSTKGTVGVFIILGGIALQLLFSLT